MNGSRQLRRQLRAARRNIGRREQSTHSLAVSRHLAATPPFRHSARIAFYLSTDGEVDLSPLIRHARRAGKHCFLPVLRRHPALSLWFAEYSAGDWLSPNRYGICEPALKRGRVAAPWGLDMIVMPVVGFDLEGNRLGMGGGYYDRTLSYLRHRRYWKRPALVGAAHECQKIEALQPSPWDIPLDAVVTERAIYPFTMRMRLACSPADPDTGG